MNNTHTIKKHIEADVPLLILGASGWGKSATVTQVAQDLKLPIVFANATAWTAEDFGGLVRPTSDGSAYSYLPPKWAVDNKDATFIFFIDEINQANISVLHALYKVVLDREVAGIKLRMHIIACGNTADENPYLTELPEPLLKRFSVYNWVNEMDTACHYLNTVYGTALNEIYTTPRQTEMAIKLYRVGDVEAARRLGGEQLLAFFRKDRKRDGERLIRELTVDEAKKRNGIL